MSLTIWSTPAFAFDILALAAYTGPACYVGVFCAGRFACGWGARALSRISIRVAVAKLPKVETRENSGLEVKPQFGTLSKRLATTTSGSRLVRTHPANGSATHVASDVTSRPQGPSVTS